MAHYAGFITPAKASFMHSVELVIMVVFGGMASIFGAVVGAAVLTMLPQLLTVLKDYEMMVFGAVLIATMVFFPQGIVPTLARWLGTEDDDDACSPSRALGKAFGGVHAIEDVSFDVRAGTVHSIIGPNGAGKTTPAQHAHRRLRARRRQHPPGRASSSPGCRRTASPPPASAAPSRTCRCSST